MTGTAATVFSDAFFDRPAFARQFPAVMVGLAAMLFAILSIEPWPVGVFQDDGIYAILGRSLATGHGYRYLQMPGEPTATHYPPLYPAFLALLWKAWPVFPGNVVVFKFANALFTTAAAIGAFGFGRSRLKLSDRWAAAMAIAFTACAPVMLLTVMVLSEPMFLAALFPVLLLAERAADSGRPRDAVAAGAAGAALALIRTLGIVVVPALLVILLWRRRWRAAALAGAAALAVSLPWQLWVAANAHEVPSVFLGKYGSYTGWLGGAVEAEGVTWLARLMWFNASHVVRQGWETVAVDTLPLPVRWCATIALTALFVHGWWRLARRAPVSAWMMLGYLTLVLAWPFVPARFIWAIWPLVGGVFFLAFQSIAEWQPAGRARLARACALAASALLVAGYGTYNWLGASRGWWTQVQQRTADRARPLAEWIVANTRPTDVIATDDDLLIHLYTGRRTIPNGAFTPQEHMRAQTPAFAVSTLRTILGTYDVAYVTASTEYGIYAARGLLQSSPPELRMVTPLSSGAVFAPMRRRSGGAQ